MFSIEIASGWLHRVVCVESRPQIRCLASHDSLGCKKLLVLAQRQHHEIGYHHILSSHELLSESW